MIKHCPLALYFILSREKERGSFFLIDRCSLEIIKYSGALALAGPTQNDPWGGATAVSPGQGKHIQN